MINILTALGGTATAPGAATDAPAEGETPFAGLLALLGGAEELPAEGSGEEADGLGALLAEAEAALADPDLSEEEIAAIVGPVVAQLGAALAADPALLERVEALVADLSAELVDGEEAAADWTWRDLSEGLADLQGLLAGDEELSGDGDALAALLQRAVAVAEDAVRPVVPGVAGLGQLLSAPWTTRETVEHAESAEEAHVALRSVAADDAAVEADPAVDAAAETPEQSGGNRSDARPAAAFAAAATASVQQGTAQASDVGVPQLQATPLAPVSATPLAASSIAAAQVAGASPQLAVQGQDILGQIRASASGDGEINVELKPEGLGKVEVSLSPDEAGRLQVVVRADHAAVLSSLRADRDGLLALLREAGHAVEDGALSFSDMGAQGGSQNGGQDRGTGRTGGFTTYGRASTEAPGLEGAATTQSRLLPAGSVDISI